MSPAIYAPRKFGDHSGSAPFIHLAARDFCCADIRCTQNRMVRFVDTPWCHKCDLLRPLVWPVRTARSGSGTSVIIELRNAAEFGHRGRQPCSRLVLTHVLPDTQWFTHPSVVPSHGKTPHSELKIPSSVPGPTVDSKSVSRTIAQGGRNGSLQARSPRRGCYESPIVVKISRLIACRRQQIPSGP